MRRIMSLLVALLLFAGLVCPALAAQNVFVPSISYKDGPDIEDAELEGEGVGDCLVVTTITEAREKTTDIYQEDRDLLLEVYEKLEDGSMKLPLEEDYVIRELVDVSWKKTSCVEAEHGHKEWLHQDDTTISVIFDLGVGKNTEVVVMVYLDGEWVEAESVVNNSDGTVTVVFEDICPVAFCVKRADQVEPPKTGDPAAQNMQLYIIALVVSAVALIALLIWRGKKRK